MLANGDTAMKYGITYFRHLPFQGWRGHQEDRRRRQPVLLAEFLRAPDLAEKQRVNPGDISRNITEGFFVYVN